MENKDILETEGIIVEKLPNAMFRVRLNNGREIIAHI